jgi:hypothetical protein
MRNKPYSFLFFFLFISPSLWAQTGNWGSRTSIGAEKELGKWDFDANVEFRTKYNFEQTDRWCFQLNTAYSIIKPIKIGAGYEFIYFYDLKYSDYQPRQRYLLFLEGKQSIGKFKFSIREQFQRTIKDERDRIKDNGKYDHYNINPEWYWRNRIKVAYNIPKCPITPSFSFEAFFQLNNSDGNQFDKLRYTLSVDYKLHKRHKFQVYGLIDQKINVETPVNRYIIGLGYTYSFKK